MPTRKGSVERPRLPKDDAFGISFNTKTVGKSGLMTYTKVILKTDVIGMDEGAYVNLCEHPLYPELVAYVEANPIRSETK